MHTILNIYDLLSLDTVIFFSFTQIDIIWQIIQAQQYK